MKTKQIVIYNVRHIPEGHTLDSVIRKFKEENVLIHSTPLGELGPKVIEIPNVEE